MVRRRDAGELSDANKEKEMTERDKELVEQATKYALGLNPEEDAYGNPLNRDKFQRDRDACFADIIRADERERIKAANEPEIERINAHLKSLEDAVRDEREACAELRHKLKPVDLYNRSEMLGVMNQGLDDYQQLIRARGNT